jgi:hypothetical protein
MKNVIKMLGIIALLAIIVGMVGCSVDADDQTTITIKDIPAAYEDKYAAVVIVDSKDLTKILGTTLYAKPIKGNTAKEIAMYDESGAAVIVKEGIVCLFINSAETMDGDDLYAGRTDKAKTLGKGGFEVSAGDFVPDITKVGKEEKPTATNYGTYTTKYKNSSGTEITETIIITESQFKISDNSGGRTGDAADYLDFKIVKWEIGVVPEDYVEYTGAFKFTGKILGQRGYCPSDKTAPKFTDADVDADGKGPDCWMSIYFSGETGSITFIRTSFSKAGNVNNGVVTDAAKSPRVYTKS